MTVYRNMADGKRPASPKESSEYDGAKMNEEAGWAGPRGKP